MKKTNIIIVACISIILFAVTNPTENKHIKVLSERQMSNSVYRNYLLCSVVYGAGHPVSFGVLNNIFPFKERALTDFQIEYEWRKLEAEEAIISIQELDRKLGILSK